MKLKYKQTINKIEKYHWKKKKRKKTTDSQYQLKKKMIIFVSAEVSERDRKLKFALVRPPFRDFRHRHKK